MFKGKYMTNNDVFRKLRYILNYSDQDMKAVFANMDTNVPLSRVQSWLKKEEDYGHLEITDRDLALFLNGLIVAFRGKKDGRLPVTESNLTHNIVLRKLKIAYSLQAEEMLDIWKLAQFRLSKHELSAFFRKPDHRHYRECKDQILRNFLQGMAIKNRQ